MKKTGSIVFLFILQPLLAGEYDLNEASMHTDARDMALGGLICNYDAPYGKKLSLNCLLPFQMKELSTRKLSYSQEAFGMDWGTSLTQNGDAVWTENMVSLKASRKLNKILSLGVQVFFLDLQILTEKAGSAFFAEVDCQYHLSEKTQLSLLVINPSGTRIKKEGILVPLSTSGHAGIQYYPLKKGFVCGEIDLRLHQKPCFRFGLEYSLGENLDIRTGLSTSPLRPSWGIGCSWHRWRYAYGGNLHPILGISSGVTLDYSW
jgi:hypothetical protein